MGSKQLTSCTISSRHCACFEQLTNAEQKKIEENTAIVKYKKGELICKQGAMASQILYIESGLAKVFLDNGNDTLVLKVIPPGNLLGLTSIGSENSTFQYSALAYVDSVVKQVEISCFKEMLHTNPKFASEVIEILISNTVQINGRFFCLTHKQSYGRLADILLCLADRIFYSQDFLLPLSRKELAELSGISVETVVRMLKKFNDEGLISTEGKNLRILDYQKLKMISEMG
jgi:CRP/FNR family transcriptional regulator